MRGPPSHPHVLVLARNYPNPAFPSLGMWAERLVQAAQPFADSTVVAPVPWVPPLVPHPMVRRFRAVPRQECRGGVTVHHPRVPLAPGYALHALDAALQYPRVRRLAAILHARRPFQLIHAHFIYPEGVIAARLGRRLGLPVISTEHALWQPWLDQWPAVRRQVLNAIPAIARVTAVSEAVRASIEAVAGDAARTALLPNVVDETVFRAPRPDEAWDLDQLLFVGAVRRVKGLDVLIQAMPHLLERRPGLRLLVLGEAFYAQWRRDERAVRGQVEALGLSARVTFAGRATPAEVAAAMRRSALLIVPARRESFSVVAVEALASGTPVVATRCGGPEDFLTHQTGALVEPDDPLALAEAIEETLQRRPGFDRLALRREVVERFGWAAATARMERLYAEVLQHD